MIPKLFEKAGEWQLATWDPNPYWYCEVGDLNMTLKEHEPNLFWASFGRLEGYDIDHVNGFPLTDAITWLRNTYIAHITDGYEIIR